MERLQFLYAYEFDRENRRQKDFELWKGRHGTKRMTVQKNA